MAIHLPNCLVCVSGREGGNPWAPGAFLLDSGAAEPVSSTPAHKEARGCLGPSQSEPPSVSPCHHPGVRSLCLWAVGKVLLRYQAS